MDKDSIKRFFDEKPNYIGTDWLIGIVTDNSGFQSFKRNATRFSFKGDTILVADDGANYIAISIDHIVSIYYCKSISYRHFFSDCSSHECNIGGKIDATVDGYVGVGT